MTHAIAPGRKAAHHARPNGIGLAGARPNTRTINAAPTRYPATPWGRTPIARRGTSRFAHAISSAPPGWFRRRPRSRDRPPPGWGNSTTTIPPRFPSERGAGTGTSGLATPTPPRAAVTWHGAPSAPPADASSLGNGPDKKTSNAARTSSPGPPTTVKPKPSDRPPERFSRRPPPPRHGARPGAPPRETLAFRLKRPLPRRSAGAPEGRWTRSRTPRGVTASRRGSRERSSRRAHR